MYAGFNVVWKWGKFLSCTGRRDLVDEFLTILNRNFAVTTWIDTPIRLGRRHAKPVCGLLLSPRIYCKASTVDSRNQTEVTLPLTSRLSSPYEYVEALQ